VKRLNVIELIGDFVRTKDMPLLFWVVPYIIAGGVMWFVSSQTAPFGREIKLSQAIVAVILMGLCSAASHHWLKPVIGDWRFLAEFVAWILVVMLTLQLSFWRSLLAVIIYFVVMVAALIVMGIVAKSGGAPNHALHRTAAPRCGFDAPGVSDAGFAASARFRPRSVS
jgi:hypothetical protein